MRILIQGLNFSPECIGIGKYTSEMADWLISQGHEIRVITSPPYYPKWQVWQGYKSWRYSTEIRNGIRVYRCPLWVPKKVGSLKRILHLLSFSFSSAPMFISLILWKPEVIFSIAPAFFSIPMTLVAAKMSGAKSWLHIQDFEIDAAFKLGFLRFSGMKKAILSLERWLMRRFDRVSTISGRMMERLEMKGVNPKKLFLFSNWVDTEQIKPLNHESLFRSELGIRPGEIIALYSGNMGEKQGMEIVIDTARILESEKKLRFVMCGQGSAYDRLRSMADGLKNMIWIQLQPMERLNELLNLADIHLLPQRSDAADLVMPSKLTGILASGRPVVATADEGTEVWIATQGRGITTSPGDVQAFANAILELTHDLKKRINLGQKGRDYAEKYLGRENILVRFEDELLQL